MIAKIQKLSAGGTPPAIQGNLMPLFVDPTTGRLLVDIGANVNLSLTAQDIQIGAVELKDATTANRAIISALGALLVDLNKMPTVDSAAVGAVTAAASNTTLAAANGNRKGLIIFNDSNKILYVKYGATATVDDWSYKILAGGYWEMPTPIYTGIIDGIWEADVAGKARVTQL